MRRVHDTFRVGWRTRARSARNLRAIAPTFNALIIEEARFPIRSRNKTNQCLSQEPACRRFYLRRPTTCRVARKQAPALRPIGLFLNAN